MSIYILNAVPPTVMYFPVATETGKVGNTWFSLWTKKDLRQLIIIIIRHEFGGSVQKCHEEEGWLHWNVKLTNCNNNKNVYWLLYVETLNLLNLTVITV